MTRPTHPITPATATVEAVINVAAAMAIALIALVFTPSDLASSSERDRRFILQERSNIGIIEVSIGGIRSFTSSIPAPASDPIRKYVIAGSSSSGSATSFIKLVPDWKRELIMMPPRIRPRT